MKATVKILQNAIKKQEDTTIYRMQLLSSSVPYHIPENAIVRLYVADYKNLLIEKIVSVVDYENGIVEFPINEKIESAVYNCEFIVTYNRERITFPTANYQSFKLVPNLGSFEKGKPLNASEYEFIIDRIEYLEDEILDIPNHYYNKAEVDTLIANATFGEEGGETIDLTKYALKVDVEEELTKKPNYEEVHLKEEFTVETYTEEEVLDLWKAMFN